MSALLPEGCRSLIDAPYVLHDAIVMALHFLKFEERPNDERPPKRIWLDPDALKAHWEGVERMLKARYGVEGKDIDGPSEKNDAAKDLIL